MFESSTFYAESVLVEPEIASEFWRDAVKKSSMIVLNSNLKQQATHPPLHNKL